MQNALSGVHFRAFEEVRKWVDNFIASKDETFFASGIRKLPERWLKKSAAEAHRLLVEAYGEAALSERSCRKWFQKFKNGEFDVEDKKRSEDEELEALLNEDSCQTQKALTLGAIQQAISHRLKSLGMIQKQRNWEKCAHYYSRHDKIIFLHNNARPHVAAPVKTYMETLNWEVLPHPPYSPDIAPSDYHLFRSMALGLSKHHFTSYEDIKNWIDNWIASKDEAFFQRGIRMLPEKWKKVVASDGQYFQ
ncbi:MOS1T transposase, partial [Pseudoatta argentina]